MAHFYAIWGANFFETFCDTFILPKTVPRLINNACTNSLIYAYQNRRTIIDDKMVQQVIDGET